MTRNISVKFIFLLVRRLSLMRSHRKLRLEISLKEGQVEAGERIFKKPAGKRDNIHKANRVACSVDFARGMTTQVHRETIENAIF